MSPIGLVFSIPLVISTRHVPHWPNPWQLRILVDPRAEAVYALVHVDAGLDGLLAQIGAVGNVDFLVFLDELDKRHIDRP